jgi:hypothetical protein
MFMENVLKIVFLLRGRMHPVSTIGKVELGAKTPGNVFDSELREGMSSCQPDWPTLVRQATSLEPGQASSPTSGAS